MQALLGPSWLAFLNFDWRSLADIITGTRVIQLSRNPATDIRTRLSETNQCIIKIACPAGNRVFTTLAVLVHQPDCTADYTSLLRFPCVGSSCAVDWTK
jgi:hypothetical protein